VYAGVAAEAGESTVAMRLQRFGCFW